MPASIERAGNWLFGTGLRADFESLKARLLEAGSSLSLVARLDQYYADARHVAPYHAARKQAFAPDEVAPSTSVVVSRLLNDAAVDLQVIAATSASGYLPERIKAGLNRPAASGYTPCMRLGELIFVAGQLARDSSGAMAVEGVGAETGYIIEKRLRPALDAAGSGLDLVLKAQAYVSRPQDLPAFWQAWTGAFGKKRLPPTTVIPLRHPAFLSSEATVEVNIVAAHASVRSRLRDVECEVEARTFGGLLFVAGLSGTMDEIRLQAKRIFSAAGSDLSRVVRAVLFCPSLKETETANPGFPFTAVETTRESGLILDLWGYAP